ncbi:MAG: chitobiase/beta-hexosaminidase C-terminal domain-containing protein [Clostridiales bacterium]|nr:chitobiase/beta-hexosaminidase C-terminal domain-containing protein [Clostridiales bacterium]
MMNIMRISSKSPAVALPTVLLILLCMAACGAKVKPSNQPQGKIGDDVWRIHVVDHAGDAVWSFTEVELIDAMQSAEALPSGAPGRFAHAYSTINNWPAAKFYAADGYSIALVLSVAGLYEDAQTVTFKGADGYAVSLTREQLLSPRFSYPNAGENEDGAEPVYALLAWRWREGTADVDAIRDDKPCLIIGQSNPFEHTNPAYVVGVEEILVSQAPCEQWPPASTFPLPGFITAGETVKLQHPDYGLVKLHYTLDGSEPTTLSPMYNPSTFRPEMNAPIPILRPTVIKALVVGYGKSDSDIAEFRFTIAE